MDEFIPTIVGSTDQPATPSKAIRLGHRTGSLQGQRQEFQDAPVLIGRRSDAQILFDHETDFLVSGHHAKLVLEADGWWIEDLTSTNGTFVNARRVDSRTRLRSGDVIALGNPETAGSATFAVEIDGESAPSRPDWSGGKTPSVSPFLRGAPPPAARPSADGGAAAANPLDEGSGLIGKLKGAYRRFVGRREVQREVDELSQVRAARALEATQSCARLARALWQAREPKVDWKALRGAADLEAWEGQVAAKREELGELRAETAKRKEALEEWTRTWTEGLAELQQRADLAAEEATAAEARSAEAKAALRALVEPRANQMRELASELLAFADGPGAEPAGDFEERHRSLVASAKKRWKLLGAEIEGLPAATSEKASAADRATSAAEALSAAREAVATAEKQRAERVEEDRRAQDAADRRGADLEASLREKESAAQDLFAAAGREIVDTQVAELANSPELQAATDAVRLLRETEKRLADLEAALRDIGGE